MLMFSEHPCFTVNSVSSEHPPCFHYFVLAQPTTDKQIEEVLEGLGWSFVKYLFIFKHFIYSHSYSTMSKTSAVWQPLIKIENGKKLNAKFANNSLYITARLQTWHITYKR